MTSYLGGDLVQGTAYYKQAIAHLRQLDDRHGLTSSLATLALSGATYQTDSMVSAASNLAEGITNTEQALKIAREIGQRPAAIYALFQLALCLGSQGEFWRALATAQQSLVMAKEIEHREWQTAAHTVLGGIYVLLGDLYQSQRRHKEAEQAFETARRIIEELATTITEEALRDNFMHQATRMLPHAGSLSSVQATKHAFGGLSKREREIAVLIAEGKSNREIADRLVLSEHTIESHISRILLKLDYISRTQIATWVIENGLTREKA